jgi:hypothetical protein
MACGDRAGRVRYASLRPIRHNLLPDRKQNNHGALPRKVKDRRRDLSVERLFASRRLLAAPSRIDIVKTT